MMKKFTLSAIALSISFIQVLQIHAQCSPLSASYWGEMLPNAGCGTFASYSPFGPGQYFRMPVLQGGSYTISTCGASINTQITGFQQGNNSTPIFFNDDSGPICGGTNASVNYTSTFSNYLNVNVNQSNCLPGGTSSITVQVRQNNNLSITSSSTDMCEGQTRNLAATPTAVVGSPPVGSGNTGTFSGTGVSGTTFTAPTPAGASGVYTITYTFGYCSTTQNITVWRNPTPANAGSDQTVCSNSTVLNANIPNYGTGLWTIVSGPGNLVAPGSPNSTINGLVNGQTTVCRWTVTNGPCTISTDDVSIVVNSLPTTSDAGNDTSVCGSVVTLGGNTPLSGVGTWTLVSGSGTINSPNSPNSTVSGLGVGPNTFRWTIANSPCANSTDDVVINRLPDVNAVISSSSDVSCFGAGDGSATVLASGGDGNFGYLWSPGGGTLATESGLSGGFYTVTVTDGNGCTASASVTITEPLQLSVGASVTDPLCYGESSGSIDVTVSGGTSPFVFNWNNGATTEDISGLSSGSYSIVVTDDNGCQDSTSVSVIDPAQISITPSITSPDCFGDNNGSISLSVVGGAGSYTFNWNTSATSNSISGLTAGIYVCTVTDTLGCSVIDSITVTEPGELILTSVVTDEISGFDGAIDLSVSGGTAPFVYSWSNAATWQDLNGLVAGTYQVTVTDANGCSATHTAIVNASNSLEETSDNTIQVQPNPSDGQFQILIFDKSSTELNLQLFDLTGRLVINKQLNIDGEVYSFEVNITNEPSGVYVLQLNFNDSTNSKVLRRLIKN